MWAPKSTTEQRKPRTGATTPELDSLSCQPMHPILVRKHVPDSDPGCALQSTSMPILHGRNVPDCRPMVDGGLRKCSAGACPPLGSGWGVAETAVPIRCTKPQLPLFIPWCAGGNRHERLVRKHVPDSDPGWMVPVTTVGLVMPASVGIPSHSSFVRKCAYAAFERAVEPLHSAISSIRPLNSSFPRRRESRGEVRVVAMTLELSHQPMHPNFHTLVCRRQPG